MSIVVHSLMNCKYCDQTKEFLNELQLPMVIVMYDKNHDDYQERKDQLVNQTNSYTFPQIFINNTFIGGYQELTHLYNTLKLHDMCKELGYELNYDF